MSPYCMTTIRLFSVANLFISIDELHYGHCFFTAVRVSYLALLIVARDRDCSIDYPCAPLLRAVRILTLLQAG